MSAEGICDDRMEFEVHLQAYFTLPTEVGKNA
jgi:hypothetical protein